MANPVASSYIDKTSIATFGVATGGILAVMLVMRKVFKINHPIVPLVASLLISVGLAINQNALDGFLDWLVVLLNAALLFSASVGMNETATDGVNPKPPPDNRAFGSGPMPWFKSLFD